MRPRTAALALFPAGLLTGAAYLASGWFWAANLVFTSLAAIGLVASLLIGLRREHTPLPGKRLRAGALCAAAWVIPLCLPAALRWAVLRYEASQLPVPGDLQNEHLLIDVVAFNARPDFFIGGTVANSPIEAATALRRAFEAEGWTLREPERYGVSFMIPTPRATIAAPANQLSFVDRHVMLGLHEPDEPIMEGILDGMTICKRGRRSLALWVQPASGDWNTGPAVIRIYPFERPWPLTP